MEIDTLTDNLDMLTEVMSCNKEALKLSNKFHDNKIKR